MSIAVVSMSYLNGFPFGGKDMAGSIAIGIAIGVGLGAAFDNVGMGIGIGIIAQFAFR
jgi:hypothetical protein